MTFMHKTVPTLLFLASICFFVSCKEKKDKKEAPKTSRQRPAPKVDGFIIRTEAFSETIEVPGSVLANEATEIHPEVSGRVISLNAREGQFVSKGSVIAKIYDGDLQAQLRKLQTQLAIAKTNEERAAKLLEIQGISKQDYDASLLNVRNIQADIDIIRADISRTEVRAPFNGKMGLKGISPGAYITPATVIASINQVSTLKIDFSVPEKYTNRIRLGQIVTFTVEGSDKEYAARISATASNVDAGNRSLMTRAIVNSSTAGLLPGLFARVKIIFSPNPNAIFVPTNAVIPSGRNNQIIISRDGKAVFSNVETGVRDSSRVEIVKGLLTGDTILVTGIMSVKPKDPLSFRKIIN